MIILVGGLILVLVGGCAQSRALGRPRTSRAARPATGIFVVEGGGRHHLFIC